MNRSVSKTAALSRLAEDSAITAHLAEIFETIDQGITLYDKDHRLILWNRRYETFEVTPPQFLHHGASLLDAYEHIARSGVFGAGDPHKIAQNRITSLMSGPIISTELLTPPNGKVVRIRRFRLKDGGFCATFRDVTEEIQREQQLQQIAKLEAIGELTAGMAHDLNNLLGIILGNLDLAIETGEKDSPYLQKAVQSVERGSDFVQRLLAFARQQPLDPKRTDVGALLLQFVLLFPPSLRERIRVESSQDQTGLYFCEVDPNQLESVMMNLVINAKDAGNDESPIELKLSKKQIELAEARALETAPGLFTEISVTDHGRGMSTETVQKALEPFFTTKPAGFGTGLGLSMANRFCRQAGGAIKIESIPESGTTVRLYVPCAKQAGAQ